MKTITLNESLEYIFELNEENQYLKVKFVRIYFKKDIEKINSILMTSQFKFELIGIDNILKSGSTLSNPHDDFNLKRDGYYEKIYNYELLNSKSFSEKTYIKYIKIFLENNSHLISELIENVEIFYSINHLFIDINETGKYFSDYINQHGNCKILFSAPFGQGKTTFLKEYFNNNKEYETFFLYPVNYSVAQNEDIFQYIKCEILFQLLGKDIEFKMEEFSKKLTSQFFILDNIDTISIQFLRFIPKIGGNLYEILNAFNILKKKFIDYHSEINYTEEESVKDFIKLYYEKEGSIYEDNYYTQLIRQYIYQLNESGKKTVLVIDDLDRMDPEHIFRILNVFAAHFDDNMYESQPNKFGFDRIILVCDYNNLAKIFAHKYGNDTDYKGYINKFYSKDVFKFDNSLALNDYLKIVSTPNDHIDLTKWNYILKLLFIDFISIEEMTLREIYKNKHILEQIQVQFEDYNSMSYHLSFFLKPLKFFNEVWGFDGLLKALNKAKERIVLKRSINGKELNDLEYIIACSIIALNYDYENNIIQTHNIAYKTENNQELILEIAEANYSYISRNKHYNPINYQGLLQSGYMLSDYYICLIYLAKQFRQMGWLN